MPYYHMNCSVIKSILRTLLAVNKVNPFFKKLDSLLTQLSSLPNLLLNTSILLITKLVSCLEKKGIKIIELLVKLAYSYFNIMKLQISLSFHCLLSSLCQAHPLSLHSHRRFLEVLYHILQTLLLPRTMMGLEGSLCRVIGALVVMLLCVGLLASPTQGSTHVLST